MNQTSEVSPTLQSNTDSTTPIESNPKQISTKFTVQAPINPQKSVLSSSSMIDRPPQSPRSSKHYSDNLYSLLDNGIAARRRMTRSSTTGRLNPILDSIGDTRRMLLTKQALRACKNRKLKKEFRLVVNNADENLDKDDPFQAEGFSINVKSLTGIEFNYQEFDEFDSVGPNVEDNSKFAEAVEKNFDDKAFGIVITEGVRTRKIGDVKLVDGEYHMYDVEGNYVFQIEKISKLTSEASRLTIIKKNQQGEVEEEYGFIEFNPWKTFTLEAEAVFRDICSSKEKMMILGTALVLMMKIPAKEGGEQKGEGPHEACSVRSIWNEVVGAMGSLFRKE